MACHDAAAISKNDVRSRRFHQLNHQAEQGSRKKIMKLGICAIVAASALLAGGTASAQNIDLSYGGLHFGNSNTLTAQTNYGHFYAGAMDWTVTGGGESYGFNVGDQITTFCTEVTQTVQANTDYGFTELDQAPNSSGGMGEERAGLVQSLYDNYFSEALNSAFESAAFQIAIWEIVYESSTDAGGDLVLDASTGPGFRVTGGSADNFSFAFGMSALDLANEWLSTLTSTEVTTLLALTSGSAQDQILLVPLPAPILMAGLGLLAVPVLRRRFARN